MSYKDLIKLSEKGTEKGGEKDREELIQIALEMYEKIKLLNENERRAILKIMGALSEQDSY